MHSVQLTERAIKEISKINDWWAKHRSAAPSLFSDELALILAVLSEQPLIGALINENRRIGSRSVVLFRSGYNVFYRARKDGSIWVTGVRHVRRKPRASKASKASKAPSK